jgi:hypothetical protein
MTRQAAETRHYADIGVLVPRIFLPAPQVDLTRWAVVACDQYTSQPEYWQEVERLVGDAPSTLRLTLPEVYLGKPGEAERVAAIQASMRSYLEQAILAPQEGLVYVERSVGGKTRRGLLLCLDLEAYDYTKGSSSLIRATEGTIVERLPPRMKIREGAPLELPHILVLIDDPQRSVIEPIGEHKQDPGKMVKRYDFDLMLGSGRLTGYQVADPGLEGQVVQALRALADPQAFADKYGVDAGQNVLLFAMGDGNHSLATAKALWEKIKPQVGMDHPARFALVEVENVHDEGLEFEPIHRLLFEVRADLLPALEQHFGAVRFYPVPDTVEMERLVNRTSSETGGKAQAFGLVIAQQPGVVEIGRPLSNLAVGSLQAFLDDFLKHAGAGKIDYLHGNQVLYQLAGQPGTAGFYLPPMDKSDLFKTVILDGALPRKTFSMGEAHEKRFYMEARKIA